MRRALLVLLFLAGFLALGAALAAQSHAAPSGDVTGKLSGGSATAVVEPTGTLARTGATTAAGTVGQVGEAAGSGLSQTVGTVRPVTDQLDPVTDQLDPVTDSLGRVDVTEPVDPVTDQLDPVTDSLGRVDVTEPVDEIDELLPESGESPGTLLPLLPTDDTRGGVEGGSAPGLPSGDTGPDGPLPDDAGADDPAGPAVPVAHPIAGESCDKNAPAGDAARAGQVPGELPGGFPRSPFHLPGLPLPVPSPGAASCQNTGGGKQDRTGGDPQAAVEGDAPGLTFPVGCSRSAFASPLRERPHQVTELPG